MPNDATEVLNSKHEDRIFEGLLAAREALLALVRINITLMSILGGSLLVKSGRTNLESGIGVIIIACILMVYSNRYKKHAIERNQKACSLFNDLSESAQTDANKLSLDHDSQEKLRRSCHLSTTGLIFAALTVIGVTLVSLVRLFAGNQFYCIP